MYIAWFPCAEFGLGLLSFCVSLCALQKYIGTGHFVFLLNLYWDFVRNLKYALFDGTHIKFPILLLDVIGLRTWIEFNY